MELNYKNIKRILLIIFLGSIIFISIQHIDSVMGFFNGVISIFSPIIAALCLAFVLNVLLTPLETKVFRFMDKSKRKFIRALKRPICLILTYVLSFGIFALLILFIIPEIIETVTYLAEKMPAFITQTTESIENFLISLNIKESDIPELKIDWNAVASTVKNTLSGSSQKIVGSALNITTSVFSGVFNGIFSFVISIYVLAQKEKIGAFTRRVIDAFIPKKATMFIYHIAEKTYELFSKFIGGQLVEAVILGVLCFIGMEIFRFPNAAIISVVISATALVPVVGATIGMIVGFLLIVITSPVKAFLFIVFLLTLQQLENNLIYPKVVGKAVGLPGVIVVSAVLVGGNVGGMFGALISVPTAAVIYTLLNEMVDFLSSKNKVAVKQSDEAGGTDENEQSDSEE